MNVFIHLHLQGEKYYLDTIAFITLKRERIWSYFYCNDDGLVGPERLLRSHFNCRSPNRGPRCQEAFLINVHHRNLLGPVEDAVAQGCCTNPLENKTEPFSHSKSGSQQRARVLGFPTAPGRRKRTNLRPTVYQDTMGAACLQLQVTKWKLNLENKKFQGKHVSGSLESSTYWAWLVSKEGKTMSTEFLSSTAWGIYSIISEANCFQFIEIRQPGIAERMGFESERTPKQSQCPANICVPLGTSCPLSWPVSSIVNGEWCPISKGW